MRSGCLTLTEPTFRGRARELYKLVQGRQVKAALCLAALTQMLNGSFSTFRKAASGSLLHVN